MNTDEIELLIEFYRKGVLSYEDSIEAIRILLHGGKEDERKV